MIIAIMMVICKAFVTDLTYHQKFTEKLNWEAVLYMKINWFYYLKKRCIPLCRMFGIYLLNRSL